MTRTKPRATRLGRKVTGALGVGIRIQLALATAAVITGWDGLYLAAAAVLLLNYGGWYLCRDWRRKWQQTAGLDERELVLYLRARSKGVRQLQRLLGPVLLVLALGGLADHWKAIGPADLDYVVILVWGIVVAIDMLPTLQLIEAEAEAEDEERVVNAGEPAG